MPIAAAMHCPAVLSNTFLAHRRGSESCAQPRRQWPRRRAKNALRLCRRRHKIHKARNIMERLPKALHASVRRALRQAWELDDADKAEKLLRNLAQRLERDWSGVASSILEGIDEILTVTRLGLPQELPGSV